MATQNAKSPGGVRKTQHQAIANGYGKACQEQPGSLNPACREPDPLGKPRSRSVPDDLIL